MNEYLELLNLFDEGLIINNYEEKDKTNIFTNKSAIITLMKSDSNETPQITDVSNYDVNEMLKDQIFTQIDLAKFAPNNLIQRNNSGLNMHRNDLSARINSMTRY